MCVEFTVEQSKFAKTSQHESKCVNQNWAALKKKLIIHFSEFSCLQENRSTFKGSLQRGGRGRSGFVHYFCQIQFTLLF